MYQVEGSHLPPGTMQDNKAFYSGREGFVAETFADRDGLLPLTGPSRSAIKTPL